MNVSFNERLNKLIIERKLSQSQFATETGITRARLNNYIKGRSEPGYDILLKMAKNLHVSIDYLLGAEETSTIHTPGLRNGKPEFYQGEEPPKDNAYSWIPLYSSLPHIATHKHGQKPKGWFKAQHDDANKVTFQRPYALLIEDDSMHSELLVGDIVFIQPAFVSHTFLQTVPFKEIFAVRMSEIDEIGLSLKRCHVKDNMLICVSDNPSYEPIVLDMNQTLFVPLVGSISGLWRSYEGRSLQNSTANTDS